MLVKEPDNISLDIKHGFNHSSACKANIIAVCAERSFVVCHYNQTQRGNTHRQD